METLKRTIFIALSIPVLYSVFTSHRPEKTPNLAAGAMDSSAFDFWVGEWNATWTASGTTYHAENDVKRIMKGHFIHESFVITDGPNKGYKGESFSTLDKQNGVWKQTWIDNQGAYLDFVGKQEGDVRIFERSFTNKTGDNIRQRMRFRNITRSSFDWDWQRSKNNGDWQMLWQLRYTKKKSSP